MPEHDEFDELYDHLLEDASAEDEEEAQRIHRELLSDPDYIGYEDDDDDDFGFDDTDDPYYHWT